MLSIPMFIIALVIKIEDLRTALLKKNEVENTSCVLAGDIDGLANAMKDFIENREKYQECGTLGREYFKLNFRKNIFIERLEKELDLLGGK